MNNETIVALAWLIGQLTATSIAILLAQISANKSLPEDKKIMYGKVAVIYLKREYGYKVVAFCGLLTMLFLFPDFWNADINVMDLRLKPVHTWKERIMIYQRTTAYVIGGLIDLILILAFRRGITAVKDFSQKVKIG